MSIIEFIKKQRYLSKAIKQLLTPKDRLKLKEKTRYYVIDPDKDSDDLAKSEWLDKQN